MTTAGNAEREQPDEVALPVAIECHRPERLTFAHDLVVERRDRVGTKCVLQHAALTAMVGVIRCAEHTGTLLVDADAEPVAPLVGPHQYVEHVGVPADHLERRIVGRFGVYRAPFADDAMSVCRLQIVGASEVRIAGRVVGSHQHFAIGELSTAWSRRRRGTCSRSCCGRRRTRAAPQQPQPLPPCSGA